jgi:hypothetical protein
LSRDSGSLQYLLEINKPVQNTAHACYFNNVKARYTAKVSIDSENLYKKIQKFEIVFLIAVSSLLVYEFMSTDKYLLTYERTLFPSFSGKSKNS